MAMPNGDRRTDARIAGPLVFLREQRGAHKDPGVILTLAEAQQLHDELGRALRAFDLAREMAAEVAAELGDRPRPYVGPYPIRGQGTLAEVG